ncbi:class I SAM-dependent methyltransferase [Schlesneria paludicola]|uniref:class I SAM-dependent methyltransferase n=1 Tax=Schlesneria paludicola TaxID=360056 RepID=UPI00029A1758|nr:class I SAM-dependent methyltransferase [Schlesneria paludicola]
MSSRIAAEMYELRTRHITFDFPALDALVPDHSCILEVGSGTGRVIQHLKLKNCHIVAVEQNADAAAILLQRFESDSSIEVIPSDFLSIPFEHKVDVVLFSFDVFSEFNSVESRIAALNQASRLLRLNGSVILFNTVVTRPSELNKEAHFEFVIGDDASGQYDCQIACLRSALFGVSQCSVEYRSANIENTTIVLDNFERALLTRNELLTLFALHPELKCTEELDTMTLAPISDTTDTIVHVLKKRT